MKKIFFFIFVFCLSNTVTSQNLNQELVSINTLVNVNAMNAISSPQERSLVYVESEELSFQYINGAWLPFLSDNLTNYIDSIAIIAIDIATETSPENCCSGEVPGEVRPAVGDILGCGILYYINPSFEWGLVAAFDEFTGPFGCVGVNTLTDNSSSNINSQAVLGPANTQTLVNNCNDPNSAAAVCNNYSSGGCNDWFLPGWFETRLLAHAYEFMDQILVSQGFPVANPINNYERVTSHEWWGSPPYENTGSYIQKFGLASNYDKDYPNTVYRPVRIHTFN